MRYKGLIFRSSSQADLNQPESRGFSAPALLTLISGKGGVK